MDQGAVSQLAIQIYDLMGEKLRVKGADLRARVRKAGRSLPRSVRRAAGQLIEAQDLSQNPVLATRIDPDTISKAHQTCLRYLKEVDPKAARSRARYNYAALLSAQFLVIAGLAITVMRWRGLI